MPRLKEAIKSLARADIARYEETGALTVAGCDLKAGDLKVLLTALTKTIPEISLMQGVLFKNMNTLQILISTCNLHHPPPIEQEFCGLPNFLVE